MAHSALGVCSWSLQVSNIPDLVRLSAEVGAEVVQVGIGDPTHGAWDEGENFVSALQASGLALSGTMIGFPGEDYTSPATIRQSGGFGDPALRTERLGIFRYAVDKTAELGLKCLCSHAGFIPEADGPERSSFLDCISEAAQYAADKGVLFTMETGQETAALLRRTLDELKMSSLRVNFDPANMILYDMGNPIEAIEILGADIAHVHAKDANPPQESGQWGEEVPLGEGSVGMAAFVEALDKAGYCGPLVVEREVGDQQERIAAIKQGISVLKSLA
ncbi:MAG: sugar phosphate isomerase/epimerase family protein [Planctomycetota bacterium]|nr:sugar phosphate isomerase/epimerase family protein [Planctomycetota bacterium]